MSQASKSVSSERTQRVIATDLLAGKWTIPVICTVGKNTLRYSAIEKVLPNITQRTLTITLRNLERNGMIDRYIYPAAPPQVEYRLTPLGLELLQFCETMDTWTKEHEEDIRRARLKQAERRAFYLYVDEFQNFATPSFVQLLSEARKYRLFLTIAEQSTSQQDDQQMVDIIMANVGTVICFRTGNPQDERMLLPLFSPFIEQGEISNLPAFNFYAKLSAIHAQEPLSGHTLLLPDDGSGEVVQAVIDHSRTTFATKYVEPEKTPTPKPEQKPAKARPKRQARKRRVTKVLGD